MAPMNLARPPAARLSEQLTSTARIVDGQLTVAADDAQPVDVEVAVDAAAWLEIARGTPPGRRQTRPFGHICLARRYWTNYGW